MMGTLGFDLVINAVNFAGTMTDTDDLSTIRGASWAMLEVPPLLGLVMQSVCTTKIKVTPIQTSASMGLFRVDVENANLSATGIEDIANDCLRNADHQQIWQDACNKSGKDEEFSTDLSQIIPHLRFAVAARARKGGTVEAGLLSPLLHNRLSLNQYQTLEVDLPKLMLGDKRAKLVYGHALAAQGRGHEDWQQQLADGTAADFPCSIDGIRPRETFAWRSNPGGPRQDNPVSRFVDVRRTFGRAGRRAKFYHEHAGFDRADEFCWANSFEEIAADNPACRPESVSTDIFGKMAVLSMDANAIAKLRKTYLEQAISNGQEESAAITAFANEITNCRKAMFNRVVKLFADDADLQLSEPKINTIDGIARTGSVLRFETLMWGGDESVFIFPAWAAIKVLCKLEDVLSDASISTLGMPDGGSRNLSYGMGLVICNHKAPIRLIKHLADELAESAKLRGKREAGAPESFVDAMILSGAEIPARSLSAERQALYRVKSDLIANRQANVFPLPLAGFEATMRAFAEIRGEPGDKEVGVPRARLADLLSSAMQGQESALGLPAGNVANECKAVRELFGKTEYISKQIKKPFGEDFLFSPPFGWAEGAPLAPLHHVLQWWNFLDFLPHGPSAGASQ